MIAWLSDSRPVGRYDLFLLKRGGTCGTSVKKVQTLMVYLAKYLVELGTQLFSTTA